MVIQSLVKPWSVKAAQWHLGQPSSWLISAFVFALFHYMECGSSDVSHGSCRLGAEKELILRQRQRQHMYTDPCVLKSIQMMSWLEEV